MKGREMERFPKATRDQIKKNMEEAAVENALVAFVDIDGQILKGRPVDMSDGRIENLPLSGPSFTGGSVPGAGQGPEHPEMVAHIIPNSYTPPLPWLPDCVFFMSNLFVNGKPHPYDPRGNLERVLEHAKTDGYVFNLGVEPEHYIVTRDDEKKIQPWNPRGLDGASMPGYNLNAIVPMLPYLLTMKKNIKQLGWGPYQVDHEDGTSQCEINWKYAHAITTCDRLMYFRYMARHVCYQMLGDGVSVTFQAKPFPNLCGSGLHIHYHVADPSGKNLFLNEDDSQGLGLSEFAYHFLAGIIEHADALCALANPTHNCYERLHPKATPDSGNHWVPVKKLVSNDNRTVMLRVPEAGHVEDRSPSAACNIYLLVAAYVAAGLDGVRNKLKAPVPIFESAFTTIREAETLPKTLPLALEALMNDTVVQEALGPIAEEFLKRKSVEHENYKSEDAFSFF